MIEDEPQLLDNICESLLRENYLVETSSDHASAIEKVSMYAYDCILLDIMLPNGSGLDVLRELKTLGRAGNVIIISAKDSLDDKLLGLELGADDYLTKPFHLAELNARIKAVIRRKQHNGSNTITLGNVLLDLDQRTVSIGEEPLALNRKEFDILNYLMVNSNRLVTRTALAEHVWGDNIDQADSFDFVYYQIKNLRKKLQQAAAKVEIKAVYGVGYKLVEA